MFVSQVSEGAISIEWLEKQPIFVRKKYVEDMKKQLEERKKEADKTNHEHSSSATDNSILQHLKSSH